MDQHLIPPTGNSSSGDQPASANNPEPSGLLIAETEENRELRQVIQEALIKKATPEDLQAHIAAIKSQDRKQIHIGIIALRKALSIEIGPPIQEVIDSGIIPLLKDFLMNDDEPYLQLEAAWALTNVASGTPEQTKTVADHRGIELFISLLKSKHFAIAEQAIWAIGNLAGDSTQYRDKILDLKGLEPLIDLAPKIKNSSYCHLIWALSNCCRGKPGPTYEKIKKALPIFADALANSTNKEVLSDSAWALSTILDSNGCEEQGGYLKAMELNLISRLVKLLTNPLLSVSVPCLRCLGALASGDSNIYIDPTFFEAILDKLQSPKKLVRKEALWMLSNIAAGTPAQSRQLVNHPTLISAIFKLFYSNQPLEVVHEIVFVIGNLNNTSSFETITELNKAGQVQFWKTIFSNDTLPVKSILPALEALQSILEKAKVESPVAEKEMKSKFEEAGLATWLKEHYQPKESTTEEKQDEDEDDEEENPMKNPGVQVKILKIVATYFAEDLS